jgi:hypothetical protein
VPHTLVVVGVLLCELMTVLAERQRRMAHTTLALNGLTDVVLLRTEMQVLDVPAGWVVT